jgi:MFS family permease
MTDNDAGTTATTIPAAPRPAEHRITRLGRFGPAFLGLQLGWALPSAAGGTLLQALLAEQHGTAKVDLLAVITTIGAVIAVISTVVAGAWSDRTRSRFGRRNPWILGGALASATGLALTGALPWLPAQIVAFALYQGGLNAMLAAGGALLPDRVAGSALGKASAYSGAGYLIGTALGSIVASALIANPGRGLMIVPWTMFIAALLLVLVLREPSTRDRPAPPSAVPRSLLPPRDRDFLLAFAGRFGVILGLTVIVFYQLYIFTDFLHIDTAAAASRIALGTTLLVLAAVVAAVIGGLVSDRLGRRKPLVMLASLLIAVAAVPMVVAPNVTALMALYVVAGLGWGLYLSVDQALMVEVLPTSGAEAKELGTLSIANSAPSVIAPVIAAVVVTAFGFHALFLFTIVVALLGGACIAMIRRVR